MSFKPLLVSAAAFAALAGASAAAQDAAQNAAQGAIAFDRAALASPAAAAALYDEIERQATRACRKQHDGLAVLGPSVRRRAVETCVTETVAAAVRAADAPELAALHGATAATRLMASRE